MGSMKAELRRFERRRLRPILQRMKPRRPRTETVTATNEPLEQLLAALLRSEIRRGSAKPTVWTNVSSTLRLGMAKPRTGQASELEALVRTMLEKASPPVATVPFRKAA
jgi:hypothetical protein